VKKRDDTANMTDRTSALLSKNASDPSDTAREENVNHSPEWPSRVVVIGLDGATFDLMKPWMEQGKLPNLKRLMDSGISRTLQSVVPPISAGAWSSFMTGKNPGKHGVFGFRPYDLGRYTCFNERLVDSTYVAGKTFLDLLSDTGHKIAMICIPITYPVWEVNGIMVAGLPTPGTGNYTWPEELGARLGTMSIPGDFHTHSPSAKFERSLTVSEARTTAAIEALQDQSFDVTVVVLSSPDDAHHHFWKFTDPSHPSYDVKEAAQYGHIPLELYKKCDEAVGRMLAHVDDDTLVIVMSDHGGGPSPTHRFNTNYWLRSQGFLSTKRKRVSDFSAVLGDVLYTIKEHLPYKEHIRRLLPTRALSGVSSTLMNIASIDWHKTKAYRVPMYASMEGIEINLQGRQPEGIVRPGEEYGKLRRLIKQQLLDSFGPNGSDVIKAISYKEEIYSGEHLEDAPDLIVELHDDYTGGINLESPLISSVPKSFLDVWSGAHRMNGIFIAQGRNIQADVILDDAEIMDLAPTILYAMGIPIPSDMDGRVLLDIFEPDFVGQHEIHCTASTIEKQMPESGLTAEEEEEMVAKLRGMGYL